MLPSRHQAEPISWSNHHCSRPSVEPAVLVRRQRGGWRLADASPLPREVRDERTRACVSKGASTPAARRGSRVINDVFSNSDRPARRHITSICRASNFSALQCFVIRAHTYNIYFQSTYNTSTNLVCALFSTWVCLIQDTYVGVQLHLTFAPTVGRPHDSRMKSQKSRMLESDQSYHSHHFFKHPSRTHTLLAPSTSRQGTPQCPHTVRRVHVRTELKSHAQCTLCIAREGPLTAALRGSASQCSCGCVVVVVDPSRCMVLASRGPTQPVAGNQLGAALTRIRC